MTSLPTPFLPTRSLVATVSHGNQQMIRWFEDVTSITRTGVPDGDKGDITVTGFGSVWTIDPGAVTLEKLSDIPGQTIIGNAGAGADIPAALTAPEVRALINVADGATANAPDAFLLDRANHTGAQTAASISDFSEAVDDRVALLAVAGTNMTITYDDVAGTLTFDATGGGAGAGAFIIDDGDASGGGSYDFDEGGA